MIKSVRDQQTNRNGISSGTQISRTLIIELCCLLLIVVSIPIVIVLSLIPTYLPTRAVSINTRQTLPFFLIYRSDLINGSSMTITNMDQLRTSLINVFNQNGINNVNARFIPAIKINNGRKKRQIDLKTINQNTLGDPLSLQFAVLYSPSCPTRRCNQQMIDKITSNINRTHTSFSIRMDFTSGLSTIVSLTLCSLDDDDDEEACRINYLTCENGGTCSNNGTNLGGIETCEDQDDYETCDSYNNETSCSDDYEYCNTNCDDDDDENCCFNNGEHEYCCFDGNGEEDTGICQDDCDDEENTCTT